MHESEHNKEFLPTTTFMHLKTMHVLNLEMYVSEINPPDNDNRNAEPMKFFSAVADFVKLRFM